MNDGLTRIVVLGALVVMGLLVYLLIMLVTGQLPPNFPFGGF